MIWMTLSTLNLSSILFSALKIGIVVLLKELVCFCKTEANGWTMIRIVMMQKHSTLFIENGMSAKHRKANGIEDYSEKVSVLRSGFDIRCSEGILMDAMGV